MSRLGAPEPPAPEVRHAVSATSLNRELDRPRPGGPGTTGVSRSGRAVTGREVTQAREESPRPGGLVVGFVCLLLFTGLGIFGLVRSRTAVIALAGDEAPDDGEVARAASRGGAVTPGGAEPAGAAPVGEGAGDATGLVSGRRKLRFWDGSIAILQSDETVLEPVSVENRRIVSVLRAGAARFEIAKRPGRVFRVIGGDAIVDVTGTKFELARVGTRLRVGVTEGRVRVSWAGGERRLGPGASGLFPPGVAARRRANSDAEPVTEALAR